MAPPTNTLDKIEAAFIADQDRQASPYIDWAWARIFADYGQRSAVFTDPRLPDNPILYATNDFYELTGYSPDEVIGRNCRLLQGPDTDPTAIAAIRVALFECRPITVDLLNSRKDGSPFWNRLRIKPVFGPGNVVERLIGVQNQIPEEDIRPGVLWSFRD